MRPRVVPQVKTSLPAETKGLTVTIEIIQVPNVEMKGMSPQEEKTLLLPAWIHHSHVKPFKLLPTGSDDLTPETDGGAWRAVLPAPFIHT